jgi:hypothetical protein
MKLKRFKQINEELDVTENDLVGGISNQEYNNIIDFVGDLRGKSVSGKISDSERVLSEVLHMIITKEKDNLDYNTYYQRRLSFIKRNKNNKSKDETNNFIKLVWWLQDEYDWDFVKNEGHNRVKFDWNSGQSSFWLNDDRTCEGDIPKKIKLELIKKGIKIK